MERFYLAALSGTYRLGHTKMTALINYFGDAVRAYEATAKELLATGLVSPGKCAKIIADRSKTYPKELETFCHKNQVNLLTLEDENYPMLLKNIQNPPTVLYVRGFLTNSDKVLSIVGSRKASSYGLKVAETFAQDLALAGLTIVSGGARGIDTAAHCGTLKACGKTIAVFGCGIDRVYPYENTKLFEQISENGALVTEFPPGTQPLPTNFPARNRIINGLSQGTLVVEAAKKSGAMITAEFAMDEGRDVYCVPGNIFTSTSAGPNSLIKDGAKLVDRPEDILEDFDFFPSKSQKNKIITSDLFSDFTTDDIEASNKVLKLLKFDEAITLEEIVAMSQMSLAVVSGILLNLQVSGFICEQTGKRYMRL